MTTEAQCVEAETVVEAIPAMPGKEDGPSPSTDGCREEGKSSKAKSVTAKHLAAEEARLGRILARETKLKESDDRFTPEEIIAAIENSFGKIDFDPCWHPASAVEPNNYLDVRLGHNGLRDPWSGNVVFVNPPWSNQDKWVKRAHDEWLTGNVRLVICLVPAATSAKVFHRVLARDAAIFFVDGRPKFSKIDNSAEATMHNCMFVVFGATVQQRERFAELVAGSWWVPAQSIVTDSNEARFKSLEMSPFYDMFSCTPIRTDPAAPRTVFCTPFSSKMADTDQELPADNPAAAPHPLEISYPPIWPIDPT